VFCLSSSYFLCNKTQETGRRKTKHKKQDKDKQNRRQRTKTNKTQDTGRRKTKHKTQDEEKQHCVLFVFVLCLVFCLSSSCVLCFVCQDEDKQNTRHRTKKNKAQDTGRRQTKQKTQDEDKQNTRHLRLFVFLLTIVLSTFACLFFFRPLYCRLLSVCLSLDHCIGDLFLLFFL
jgi:ATP-dependent Zn protease